MKIHDFDSRRGRRLGMHETDFMPYHGMKWRVRQHTLPIKLFQ